MTDYKIETSVKSFDGIESKGGITDAFTVKVDGVDFSSKYELLNDFGWIVPITTESGLKLKIKATRDVPYKAFNENNVEIEYKERKGYITLVHVLDSSVQTQVEVTQKLNEYKVECDKNEITFEPYPQGKESVVLNFTTQGGNENILLKGVRQYDENGNIKTYDNGLIVKQDGNTVIVESYGRIFCGDGSYGVVVCHSNKRDVICEVKVRYN